MIIKQKITGCYLYLEIEPEEFKAFREFLLSNEIESLYANFHLGFAGINDPERKGWWIYAGLFSLEDVKKIEQFIKKKENNG